MVNSWPPGGVAPPGEIHKKRCVFADFKHVLNSWPPGGVSAPGESRAKQTSGF